MVEDRRKPPTLDGRLLFPWVNERLLDVRGWLVPHFAYFKLNGYFNSYHPVSIATDE